LFPLDYFETRSVNPKRPDELRELRGPGEDSNVMFKHLILNKKIS
jgi:hypothetical protein